VFKQDITRAMPTAKPADFTEKISANLKKIQKKVSKIHF
jgi:hypothetical protein